MNLALIGARGVGKSKASRRLAVVLKRPVVSTDLLFSYEFGASVAGFVRRHGGGVEAWRDFRQKEYQILKKACDLENVIIDCGGGIVVDLDKKGREVFSARKVRLLRKSALVVWLRVDPDRIDKKTRRDPRRPSLSANLDLRQIMRRRAPFYRRAAHITIDAGKAKAKKLASIILKKVERHLDK